MGEPSYADISDQIDDFYFTALPNYDQTRDLIPISDVSYAKELQLQEFLFSAFASSESPDEKERKDKASSPSSQAQLVCKICMENLQAAELFRTSNACSHVFCHDCLSRYLGSKIQENISVVICPDENCKAVLEPELCQELLPSEVFERWESALCESIVLGAQKFYCPFKDCLALMTDDGEETVTCSECPSCRRLFCATCKVAWHSDLSCEEFGKLREDKASSSMSSSSSLVRLFCKICMNTLPSEEVFQTSNDCTHIFCRDCLSHYLSTKIQENIPVVKCPEENCKALLELGMCRELLPTEVFERWECEVCESMVQGAQKFYCPFEDCSAFMVDDGDEIVTHAECPNCRRLFCATCKVAWHSGLSYEEYGKLGEDEREKDDLLVIQVAKEKKWRRCPSCKYYVEKRDGCVHITCRCGFQFCYRCGENWSSIHACYIT